MTCLTTNWQKRRSQFNHDWLKNQFTTALAKWLNLLDDQIEDNDFEQSFILSVLPKWDSHRDEALAIVHDFEQQMSPQSLFEQEPLSRCDEDTKEWMGELVHQLWLVRYPVKEWVANADTAVKNTNTAYDQLQQQLQNCTNTKSAQALQPLRKQFAQFSESCQKLAKAIEQFPNEVKVV